MSAAWMAASRRAAIAIALAAASALGACGTRAAKWPALDPALGPAPPRIVEPAPDSLVKSTRPTLRWELAPGTDGARVILCHDQLCLHPIDFLDGTTSATPTSDLPTGVVYWALWGRHGRKLGESRSSTRAFVVQSFSELQGRHVQLAVPPEERAAAEVLARLADDALAFYAQVFGRALPRLPIPIFMYGSRAGYTEAARELLHGRLVHAFAFTMFPGVAHLPFYPGVGRPREGGPGVLETALLHELAHTYQVTQFRHYNDEPLWLREGLAELLAERAFEAAHVPDAARLPNYTQRVYEGRAAIEQKRFIPLARLFDADQDFLDGSDVERSSLFYAEAYGLLAMLDSPANPERQKKFRAFLRDGLSLSGVFLAWRLNRRFRALFGDAPALERELEAWFYAQPVLPWQLLNGDLRLVADGGLLLDAAADGQVILRSADRLAGDAVIDAVIERDAGSARQALVTFGGSGAKTLYAIDFHDDGSVVLLSFEKKMWKRLATRGTGAHILPPGARLKLTVELRGKQVIASLDDGELLTAELPAPPVGDWGIGAVGGHLLFHSAKVR
jgi:hypothetical protein